MSQGINNPQEPLTYASPAPVEPRRTGKAVFTISLAAVFLVIGALVTVAAAGVTLRTVLSRSEDGFAYVGAASLALVGVGLTLSALTHMIIAIQWLRRAPEPEWRWFQLWQRINRFGRAPR